VPPPSIPVEDHVRELARRLERVEERLSALERRMAVAGPAESAAVPQVTAPVPRAEASAFDPLRVITSLGRSLIILGGAFLLRALTEEGVLAPAIGVPLGLAYATAWMFTASAAAGRGDALGAGFDGAAAIAIGFPLIAEAALKFSIVPPAPAALVLAGFTALLLIVAAQRRHQTLAWLTVVAGLMTPLVMMARTGRVAPFAMYLTALGVAALWLGYTHQWKGLRWPTGFVAVLAVLVLTLRSLSNQPPEPPPAALAAQLVLIVGYLGSIAMRTLIRGRQVIVFEIVQTAWVLPVGLGGAIAVSRATASGGTALGVFLLALGVLAYAVAFQFVARRVGGAMNFHFYGALALVFVLVGTGTWLTGPWRAMAFAAIGAALAAAWSRSDRRSLGVHAMVALAAAAEASGLVGVIGAAFAGPLSPVDAAHWPAPAVLAVVLGVASIRQAEWAEPWRTPAAVAPLVIGAMSLAGVAGGLVAAAVSLVGLVRPGGVSVEALDTLRTGVLSALAVCAARLDRPGRFSAVGWFAYPLLALTGLKLVLVDLRSSTASTLFVALGCYGAALVLVPRVRARSRRARNGSRPEA
jgi:hypothetical protein